LGHNIFKLGSKDDEGKDTFIERLKGTLKSEDCVIFYQLLSRFDHSAFVRQIGEWT